MNNRDRARQTDADKTRHVDRQTEGVVPKLAHSRSHNYLHTHTHTHFHKTKQRTSCEETKAGVEYKLFSSQKVKHVDDDVRMLHPPMLNKLWGTHGKQLTASCGETNTEKHRRGPADVFLVNLFCFLLPPRVVHLA